MAIWKRVKGVICIGKEQEATKRAGVIPVGAERD